VMLVCIRGTACDVVDGRPRADVVGCNDFSITICTSVTSESGRGLPADLHELNGCGTVGLCRGRLAVSGWFGTDPQVSTAVRHLVEWV